MKYFWYWRPEENFPPTIVRFPHEYHGGDRLAVACTQTNLPSGEQKKLLAVWCDELPSLAGVRWLWLCSRVPQTLFDAACEIPNLEGLWVKWTASASIESLLTAKTVQYLHLGNCSSVASFSPLSGMNQLKWLGVEHFPKVHDLTALTELKDLEGLSIEGSMLTKQKIKDIDPLSGMADLRYLSLANVRAENDSLAPLLGLRKLETIILPAWWNRMALGAIQRSNPRMKVNELQ